MLKIAWEWVMNFISIDVFGIRINGFEIPFWLISVLLLFVILFIKFKIINKAGKNLLQSISSFIKEKWKNFISLIKTSLLQRKIRSFFIIKKNDIKNHAHRKLYVLIISFISFFIAILAYAIPKVIPYNLPELNEVIFMMSLVVILIGYIILMYTYTWLNKRKFTLPIILISIFYLFSTIEKYSLSYYLLVCLIVVLVLVYPFVLKKEWKKTNFWVLFTILLMVVSLFGGMFAIDKLYGYKQLTAYLNIGEDRYGGSEALKCPDPMRNIIIGDNITCRVKPEINILSANITFTNINGDETTIHSNNLNFIAPINNSRLYFKIYGKTKDNKPIFVSTAFDYTFSTKEESIENSKTYLKYLIALIGIIFLSIPYMMVNFKQLS